MKRYAITLDLFIDADDDNEAKDIAEELAHNIDNCGDINSKDTYIDRLLKSWNDNKCSVVSIHDAPFGQVENLREVK